MSYFKIFSAVFFAVLLALFTYNSIKNYYEKKAIEQVFSDFSKNLRSPASFDFKPKPVSASISSSNTPKQQIKPSKPEKLSEQEQICNFWKQAYSNKNTDHYFNRMQETCSGLN